MNQVGRRGSSVIVKVTTLDHDDAEWTRYYGPFLPHVGSATTSFVEAIDRELMESGKYKYWDVTVETVFIGDDESDCAVRATR